MAILKKTTVVAKPAAKTKSPVVKALSKGLSESRMEAKPAGKLVATATLQKTMVDTKNGKVIKKTTSAPVAVKMKSITEKEFNTDGKASKPMAKKEPTFTETVKRKIKQGTAYEMARNFKNDLVKPVAKVMKAKYNETFGESPKPKKKK